MTWASYLFFGDCKIDLWNLERLCIDISATYVKLTACTWYVHSRIIESWLVCLYEIIVQCDTNSVQWVAILTPCVGITGFLKHSFCICDYFMYCCWMLGHRRQPVQLSQWMVLTSCILTVDVPSLRILWMPWRPSTEYLTAMHTSSLHHLSITMLSWRRSWISRRRATITRREQRLLQFVTSKRG